MSTTNSSSLPAIIGLYQSTLEISECPFIQNHISAVRAHESNITLSGNVIFSNLITHVSGTAFILSLVHRGGGRGGGREEGREGRREGGGREGKREGGREGGRMKKIGCKEGVLPR